MITQTSLRSGVLIDTAKHSGYLSVTLRFDVNEPAGSAAEFEDAGNGTVGLTAAQRVTQLIHADGTPVALAVPLAGLCGLLIGSKGRAAPETIKQTNAEGLQIIDAWSTERPVPSEAVK